MGLNVSHTNSFQFENQNSMKNTAKDILKNQGSNEKAAEKFVETVLFQNTLQKDNSQLAIIKASYQMNINDSLKETLNYLKQHSNKKTVKKHLFGEIWDMKRDCENYEGELVDFIINEKENIFAA